LKTAQFFSGATFFFQFYIIEITAGVVYETLSYTFIIVFIYVLMFLLC